MDEIINRCEWCGIDLALFADWHTLIIGTDFDGTQVVFCSEDHEIQLQELRRLQREEIDRQSR